MEDATVVGSAPPSQATIASLKQQGGTAALAVPMLLGSNLANTTLSLTMSMEEFYAASEIASAARIAALRLANDKIAQRAFDETHARKLARYMLRGFLGTVQYLWTNDPEIDEDTKETLDNFLADLGHGPYQALQPFTANIRECKPDGSDLLLNKTPDGRQTVVLRSQQKLWIIDGQHRRAAYKMFREWLDTLVSAMRYPAEKKGGLFVPEDREQLEMAEHDLTIWSTVRDIVLNRCTVDVTVHLGLTPDQERQLFHDLNNLGKKVEPALAHSFDTANPVSQFIRDYIDGSNTPLLGALEIVDTGGKKGGKNAKLPDAAFFRDDISQIHALLFAGQTNQASITSGRLVREQHDKVMRFWGHLTRYPDWAQPGWGARTLLAQPAMVKALAYLFYALGNERSQEYDQPAFQRYMDALATQKIDFAPTAPLWRLYELTDQERHDHDRRLDDYLTPDVGRTPFTKPDTAGGSLQFASSTRDVMRYIGDLVRYDLKLPPRKKLAGFITKLIADGKLSKLQPTAVAADVDTAAA